MFIDNRVLGNLDIITEFLVEYYLETKSNLAYLSDKTFDKSPDTVSISELKEYNILSTFTRFRWTSESQRNNLFNRARRFIKKKNLLWQYCVKAGPPLDWLVCLRMDIMCVLFLKSVYFRIIRALSCGVAHGMRSPRSNFEF